VVGPISALNVLPFKRICRELVGSDETGWFIYGIVKNEYDVPQGQISTTASGLILSAVSYIALKNSGIFSNDSSG
jgi:hypothetical protein